MTVLPCLYMQTENILNENKFENKFLNENKFFNKIIEIDNNIKLTEYLIYKMN